MQKILQLGVKDWITGTGIGRHIEGSGIFYQVDGWNPYVNPLLGSDDFGLLQTGGVSSQLGSGTADEVINAFIPRITGASAGEIYALGTSGDIYAIDLSDDSVSLKSNRAVNLYNGFFSKGGGTEYFYYFQETQIGRYDIASTYTDNFWTGLTSTTVRPVHYWAQTFWFGNTSTIGKLVPASLPGTGALAAANTNVLDFDPEWTVMCLSDDDYHLVIGAATQTASLTLRGETKVFFWDGFSSSWNKEWPIPEPNIQWIKRKGTMFYANCGRALYAFNYNTPPQKIRDLDTNHSAAVGKYNAVDVLFDAICWGSVDLSTYGQFNALTPIAFATPYSFALRATNVQAINSSTKVGTIYVAGADAKLYKIPTTSGGNVNDYNNAVTHWLDLKDVYQISGMRVNFGTRLASGDSIRIQVEGYDGTSSFTQNVDMAFSTLGAVPRHFEPLSLRGHEVRFTFTSPAGNVKIKDVILYGTKTTEL